MGEARRSAGRGTVAVLKGGRSLERQVSLRSGARVQDALERLGHDVVGIDVGHDLVARLREAEPDVAFVALHGRDGEDGTVQELLEALGIPYTASGVSACMRCADKVLAKHAMRDAGIPTPDFYAFNETAFKELGAADALGAIEERLDFPIVVKPADQGSRAGDQVRGHRGRRPGGPRGRLLLRQKVLLERHVHGRDLAVSILAAAGQALPVVEAVPREEDFYDFEARYTIGRTSFVCPAELADGVTARAQELALEVFRLLGCRGFARVDLMLGGDDSDELYVLEANVIPGLTETSLLPQAAEAAGIGFDELIGRIVDLALVARGAAPTLSGRRGPLLVLAGGEVLGRDLLEEVLELLDDLLGVLDLVLELDRRLGDDVLGGEDRRARAHGERERVAGPRVDLDLAAVHGQRDRGVEGVLAQLGDRRRACTHVELAEHVEEQVVRHRPRRRRPLELHQDRGGLRGARSRSAGTCCCRRS